MILALLGTATASEFLALSAEVGDPSDLTQPLPVLPRASIPLIETADFIAVPKAVCVENRPAVVETTVPLPLAYTLPSMTVCGMPRDESALWITVFNGAVAVEFEPVMHTVVLAQYPFDVG